MLAHLSFRHSHRAVSGPSPAAIWRIAPKQFPAGIGFPAPALVVVHPLVDYVPQWISLQCSDWTDPDDLLRQGLDLLVGALFRSYTIHSLLYHASTSIVEIRTWTAVRFAVPEFILNVSVSCFVR